MLYKVWATADKSAQQRFLIMFYFCCNWILLKKAYKKIKTSPHGRERLFKKLDTQQISEILPVFHQNFHLNLLRDVLVFSTNDQNAEILSGSFKRLFLWILNVLIIRGFLTTGYLVLGTTVSKISSTTKPKF